MEFPTVTNGDWSISLKIPLVSICSQSAGRRLCDLSSVVGKIPKKTEKQNIAIMAVSQKMVRLDIL